MAVDVVVVGGTPSWATVTVVVVVVVGIKIEDVVVVVVLACLMCSVAVVRAAGVHSTIGLRRACSE